MYAGNSLYNQVAARCPNFWNKWSWGFCVIPLWWIICSLNKLTHNTYLVMYLVTIIKITSQICRFIFVTVYITKLQPDAPTFEINGHEASVWYHYDELHAFWTNWPKNLSGSVFGYNHKQKTQIWRLTLVTVYITKLQPDAPTFEINGHEASVWYHYDGSHVVWTNWPIKPIW